jgi:SAM-dependent methyltransferase
VSCEPALPIDPFAPTVSGRYEDDLVVVESANGIRPRRGRRSVRTEHFNVAPVDGRLVVRHVLSAEQVDDDLAGLLACELFGPGWVRGAELFERIFTGVVRSTADDALDSWELFYRNTLRRLDEPVAGSPMSAHGSIADYAPVYEHASRLVRPGSVLELGCCFGFLSLRLAMAGHVVTASDISAGTIRLLDEVAPRLGVTLDTRVADGARVPAEGAAFTNVLAIHLLEHLDHAHGARVVEEAVRLAARRVVIAVPLEQEVDETYGHVRTVSLLDLHRWGRASGRDYEVHEHHGGWLVIDTRR